MGTTLLLMDSDRSKKMNGRYIKCSLVLLCLLTEGCLAEAMRTKQEAEATFFRSTGTKPFNTNPSRVVCYYRWLHRGIEPKQLHSLNRPLSSDVQRNSERSACSHIILAFATIGNDFKANLSEVGGNEGVSRFVSEGRPSQETKMMISFGGGGRHARRLFGRLVANRTAINLFQESLRQLIITTGLDGVDFDWEFPGFFQSGQFGRFLEQTRLSLNAIRDGRDLSQDDKSKSSDLELSVAVPGSFTLTAGYSPEHLRDNCSFINVMTYDLVLYERWHPLASLHSALYGQKGLFGVLKPFSVEYSMANWIDLGIPKHMLLLGIPTYGVAYELVDATHTHHLAATKGYSKLGSNVNFDTVCQIRSENPNNVEFHERARVPSVHDGRANWISYDDERSVAEKAAFAADRGYGGIMIFSLNADDPLGDCAKISSDLPNNVASSSEMDIQSATLNELLSEPFPLTRIAAHTFNEALMSVTQT